MSGITIDKIDSACASFQLKDAGGDALEINADGSINVTSTISGDVNVTQGTSPWVVSAVDFDIRDLSHLTDSIKIGDGTEFLAINADGSINVVADSCNTSWQHKAATVNDTVSQIDATPLAGREEFVLQNVSGSDVYVGSSNTVTTANGILLPACSSMNFKWTDSLEIWGITAASGSSDVRLAECK